MESVKKFYLVPTEYGINIVAEMHNGEYYQQVHHSLGMDGGGASVWELLEMDNANQPIVKNKKCF